MKTETPDVKSPRPPEAERASFAETALTLGGKSADEANMTQLDWVLAKRPHGNVSKANFEYREGRIPKPKEGQLLVKNLYLSFDPTQRAVLRLALEMTRDVEVADATFSAAQRALGDDRHLFELIGVIAAYNMVSRILVAVGVRATD